MKILLFIILLIAVLVLIASRRPNTFRIARTTIIHATPESVFGHINDLHHWTAWSPWENIDPNLQRSYSGTDMGVGASYAWVGNNKVGQGSMTIIGSTPYRSIKIALNFIKPFTANNTAEFTLTEHDNDTEVVWATYGPSPLVSKIMSMFFSMDNMVGKQFEQGLTNLKMVVEKGAPQLQQ